MVRVEEITDPVSGAEYCKTRMKICEENADTAKEQENMALVAKFEGHLYAWAELLQKYQHEAWNQGKGTEDLSRKASTKKRFEGTGR